jgi:signal transduction histidine kinase
MRVEQDLIRAKEALDADLRRARVLQRSIVDALGAVSIDAIATIFIEAALECFETEFGTWLQRDESPDAELPTRAFVARTVYGLDANQMLPNVTVSSDALGQSAASLLTGDQVTGFAPELAFAQDLYVARVRLKHDEFGYLISGRSKVQQALFAAPTGAQVAGFAMLASQMEATLAAFSARSLVQQRNLELVATNDRLEKALAEAHEADRHKNEFLANVSHELRTPLNAIINTPRGVLAQLRREYAVTCMQCGVSFVLDESEALVSAPCQACAAAAPPSPGDLVFFPGGAAQLQRLLLGATKAGEHLLALVNDILDTSKAAAGKLELHEEPVHLNEIVDRVFVSIGALATEKTITLVGDGGGLTVRADGLRLTQVLVNLLANAIKFSPEKSVVSVTCQLREQRIELAVRDSGIGIAPAAQHLLFQQFRQVDGSHTRKYGGSGLGLSIVKQLAELHGGGVGVESAEGKGSTFTVWLPVTRLQQKATANPS